METAEKVPVVLSGSDKPLKPGEIAELAGLDKNEVDKPSKVKGNSDIRM